MKNNTDNKIPDKDTGIRLKNTGKHHRRRFSEFLFEGLMILIAVFLGFLAGNLREEITEHHQAKVYALSMLDDLKEDTTELNQKISYLKYAAANVDTLFMMLSTREPKEIASGKLYWYGLWGGAPLTFISNDATFQQMKSTGTLRYFTKGTLVQKIARYNFLCRMYRTKEDMDREIYVAVRESRAKIFELKYNAQANHIVDANRISFSQKRIEAFIHSNPPLLTNNKAVFNQYVELVRSRFLMGYVHLADSMKNQATSLIKEIKKDYRLK
jgi:hypothetical protein